MPMTGASLSAALLGVSLMAVVHCGGASPSSSSATPLEAPVSPPAAAGAPQPSGESPARTLQVRLRGEDTAAVLLAGLNQVARDAGYGADECALAWGELAEPVAGHSRAQLMVEGEVVLEGWFACGEPIVALAKQPRVHQIAFVSWSAGGMCASHPSGPGCRTSELESWPAAAEPPSLRTFAMLFIADDLRSVSVRELVPIMRRMPEAFLFVQLYLDHRRH